MKRLMENGQISCCGVRCICEGMRGNERVTEGVTCLLDGSWYSGMLEFKCVNTKLLQATFKVLRAKQTTSLTEQVEIGIARIAQIKRELIQMLRKDEVD